MEAAPRGAAGNGERLDDGRLDPSWFGADVSFHSAHDFDHVWVKPGFTVKGKKLRVEPWPDPRLRGQGTQGPRRRHGVRAGRTPAFANPHGLASLPPGRRRGGDGRGRPDSERKAVDFVAKGTMRASNPQATWDMKVTDAATGELLVAVHHRRLMTISTVEERIVAWLEKFGEALKGDLSNAAAGEPSDP